MQTSGTVTVVPFGSRAVDGVSLAAHGTAASSFRVPSLSRPCPVGCPVSTLPRSLCVLVPRLCQNVGVSLFSLSREALDGKDETGRGTKWPLTWLPASPTAPRTIVGVGFISANREGYTYVALPPSHSPVFLRLDRTCHGSGVPAGGVLPSGAVWQCLQLYFAVPSGDGCCCLVMEARVLLNTLPCTGLPPNGKSYPVACR